MDTSIYREQVEIQGEPLAVELYEPANFHSEVIINHGFTASKEDFSEVATFLANYGFKVLTFDTRGQHESAHSSNPDSYSMASLGRDLIELSNHFELKQPHLMGHSFGGLIAQQAVALSPHSWKSLTLFCSGPSGRTEWLQEPRFIGLSNQTKGRIWEEIIAPDCITSPRYELYRKRWLASDATATLRYREHLIHQPSLISNIAELRIPTHVIYGEHDDAWPISEQLKMAEDLQAAVTVISGCGHNPNEENPELTARSLAKFWKP